MLIFLLRRLAVAVLVALTVLTLAFMLTRLSGDLAISIAGPNATQEDVEAIRRLRAGPAAAACSSSTGSAAPLTGDLGESYFFRDARRRPDRRAHADHPHASG